MEVFIQKELYFRLYSHYQAPVGAGLGDKEEADSFSRAFCKCGGSFVWTISAL